MDSYLVYRLGEYCVKRLPIAKAYALAEKLAAMQYKLSREDRESVIANLRCILNTDNTAVLNHAAKDVFINFAKYLVDFLRLDRVDKKYVENNVKISGQEHIDGTLAQAKGMIAVTAHLGNWELCGVSLATLGYPVAAIAMDHKNKKVNDFFIRQREKKGMKIISMGMGVRRSFRVLKQNSILGIVGDRDFSGENGLYMDFFGKKLLVPRGPAVLSLKCDAPIVPAFMTRNKDGFSYDMSFEEPIVSRGLPQEEENIMDMTARMLDVIKRYIAKYPTQWFMFRPFWIAEKIVQ